MQVIIAREDGLWENSLILSNSLFREKAHQETRVEEIRSRRDLLRAAGSLVSLAVLPLPALARIRDVRQLSFYHTHTSEKLDVVYAENGAYVPEALSAIDYLLRDFRSGDVHAIDPRLLDILHTVQTRTGGSGHFEVISGFRSPATNELLRDRSNGVAPRGLSTQPLTFGDTSRRPTL